MTDNNLLAQLNANDEAATSIVLDTLMYCESLVNSKTMKDKTVREIVDALVDDPHIFGDRHEALKSVQTYINNYTESNGTEPEVAGLKMHSSSDFKSFGNEYSGAHAATFYKENSSGSKDVYVAYKGTGDGRWYDNGYAFASDSSPYQQSAAKYFDDAMDSLNVDSSCKVITTGHSKGGNLSQYVALGSKHAYLVDKVLSFDGQGFSPEAIDHFKEVYGEKFFEEQCSKMYSISGDNDFVNVLGIKLIPEENTVYVHTAADELAVPDAHALFVNYKSKNRAGEPNFFDYSTGEFYPVTEERRRFSLVADNLSRYIMTLPEDERGAICRSLMAAMEVGMNGDETKLIVGENGETASLNDIIEGLTNLDDIVLHLMADGEVQSLIDDTAGKWLREHDPFKNNLFLSRSLSLFLSIAYQLNVDKMIITMEAFVYGVSKVISTVAEVAQKVIRVVEFCSNVIDIVKSGLKYLSADYRAAKKYLKSNSIIKCDTAALRGLADRIRSVNSRLDNLDYELSRLYSEVKWTDLWNLQRADMKIGYSSKLEKCANYLSDTADRFESAEREIMGLFG